MTDQANPNELQALGDRIAELEATRAQPQVVTVEGFDGLRELSRAIETKNLDAFMLDRSMPDRMFWLVLSCIVGFGLLLAWISL